MPGYRFSARTLLAGAALALPLTFAAPALAQQAASHDPQAIQQGALEDQIAWDITEGLTTEIGPRMAGTPDEARARKWAVAKLKSLGFDNVVEEPFMMETWVRGEEKAETTSPFPQKMHITALGNSASTGAQGLEAEVVYFPDYAALEAAPAGSLKGKIAFISHKMKRTQDGSGYGTYGPARWTAPSLAASKGAVAAVIRSVGTDYHRNPHTGGTSFASGVKPIPAGALSIPDAENLERMIARGKPVRMKLVLTPRNLGQTESGNVIAEVPGSDPSAGMIVIACHLDSWDLATGAIDDASGCGIITAAAKHVMQAGQHKRTIRLLWAGAEEVGLFGGIAYARAHKDDHHALAMESDFGAGAIWRVEYKLPEGHDELKAQINQALAPLGVTTSTNIATGGADVRDIIGVQDLSVIDLQQDGTDYFDLHHTPDDTLDKIDPKAMQQNVAAWATVLAIAANYGDPLAPVEQAGK